MFKGLIIGLMLTFSQFALSAPTATKASEALDEPLTIQDCNVNVYDSGLNSTEIVNELAKCTERELSSDSYINFYVHKMFAELPDFLNMLRAEYEYLFLTAIFAILFLHLITVMAANKKGMLGKKSNFVMKTALFMFLGSVVFVNGGMQYSISWIIDKILINVTLPLTAANNYSISTRGKNDFLLNNHGNSEVHAKRIVTQLTESTACALEYRQNVFSGYNFDDKNSYNDNEEVRCFDDYVASTPSFFNGAIGRTAGSAAALYCSQQYGTVITDCGVVEVPETYGKIRSTLQTQAPIIEFYAKNWHDLECKKLAEKDEKLAEAVCKEWDGTQFVLSSTDLTEEDLTDQAYKLEDTMLNSLKLDVSTEIVVDDHYREQPLLNIFTQALFLVWSDKESPTTDSFISYFAGLLGLKNYSENPSELEKESDVIFSKIKTPEFSKRDASFGGDSYQVMEKIWTWIASSNKEIKTVEDFRYNLSGKMLTVHKGVNFKSAENSISSVINDPKIVLGDYRNNIEKEDFAVDLWLPKNIKENYMNIMLVAGSTKIMLDKKARVNAFAGNKNSLLFKKLSGLVTFFLILMAVTPIILFTSILTFFLGTIIYIITAIIGLFIKAMFIFVTKYKFEGLITSLIKILFNVYLPMSLIFTLIFAHVGVVLFLSIIDNISFFQDVETANNLLKSILYLTLTYYVYMHTFFALNRFFSVLLMRHFQSNSAGSDMMSETKAQQLTTANSYQIFENVQNK